MDILNIIIFFILGIIFGSFFTVVGLRLPRNEKFNTNKSYCDHCKHELSFFDMIPIISYLFLRGKCRYCGKKIDFLFPFMEFFTGVLFATAYYSQNSDYRLMVALGIVALLMIIVVSDISYMIIPDEVLIFMSIYFIVFDFLFNGFNAFYNILSGLFLFFFMYFIMILGNYFLKKETMGGGDVKLMFLFGLLIGPFLGMVSIFLGSVLALPTSLYFLIKEKENVIPFGPYLLIALTFIYFTGINNEFIISFIRLYS